MITAEELRRILDYDPETGIFRWKQKICKKVTIGAIAGHVDRIWGYRRIRIKNRYYRASRLAFLYIYERWPIEIDHINHQQDDDRIVNLREATRLENCRNMRGHVDNKSGFKGVTQKRNKWRSTIRADGRQVYLGVYGTKEEAYAAYCEASKKYHGEFSCVY